MLNLDNYVSYSPSPGLIAGGIVNTLQMAAQANFLHLATDQLPAGGGGGLLPIDAEVLQEMKDEEGWNDKPMIDRVLTALIATGKKKQKPAATITRLLVIVPTKSEVHMVIAFGFTPVNPDDVIALAEDVSNGAREGWVGARDWAVLLLLYGSGLRVSEATGLTGAVLPLGTTLRVTGKRNKTRIVPLLEHVKSAIDD